MRRALLLACVLSSSACSPDKPTPGEAASAPPVDPALVRARQAVGGFKQELKARLTAALAEGGPTRAIAVCQREAPRLAAAAGPGLRLGRATMRPRNPANIAEGWKLDAYHALEQAKDRKAATFSADLPNGVLAYAEPLVIDSVCLTCHGASVASDVVATLRDLYPDDRATGYALGDFRGIVWAEVERTP